MIAQLRLLVLLTCDALRRWWQRPSANTRILVVLDRSTEPMRGRYLARKAEVGQGVVYLRLRELEEAGLVWSYAEEGTVMRWYRITDAGREQVAARRREVGVWV